MSAITERLSIAAAVSSAVIILVGGIWRAIAEADFHLLNRAGALIVCVEGLLIIVEFARRNRLRIAEEEFHDNPYVSIESSRAEGQIVGIAVTLAVVGEFLHGFGDILLGWVVHSTH